MIVINWMTRKYKTKNLVFRLLYDEIKALLSILNSIYFKHVYISKEGLQMDDGTGAWIKMQDGVTS